LCHNAQYKNHKVAGKVDPLHSTKTYWSHGGIAPLILNFGTGSDESSSSRLASSPSLVGLKSRVCSAEEMNPYPCREANHKSSVVQPVSQFALPTVFIEVLSQIQRVLCLCDIFYAECRLYNRRFSVTERKLEMIAEEWMKGKLINHLTPNGHCMGRTAQLTSRCCILCIYSTNIRSEYFKHAA